MLAKEDEECYQFACKQFSGAYAGENPPRVFIVERNATLRSVLLKVFVGVTTKQQTLTVLYCTEHYRKSIRHFFDQAKDTMNKYFAGPAVLLDSLCDIRHQLEFD